MKRTLIYALAFAVRWGWAFVLAALFCFASWGDASDADAVQSDVQYAAADVARKVKIERAIALAGGVE